MNYENLSDYNLTMLYQFTMYHISTSPELQGTLDRIKAEMVKRGLELKETE